jgi:hypothetical protein
VALQRRDEGVDLFQELVPADAGVLGEHPRGPFGNIGLAGQARPIPDFAVRQQGKPAQIGVPTRVMQVGQEVFEHQLNGRRCVHVAVQHRSGA